MNFLKRKLKLQKLTARGFSHHLLLPVLVILAVGGVGAQVIFSKAYTVSVPSQYIPAPSTANGCWLAGRIWQSDNTCAGGAVGSSAPCRSKSTTYKHITDSDGKVRGYCTGAVATTVSQTTCVNSLHRMYVKFIGCARRIDQDNTNKARQCIGNNVPTTDPQAKYKNYIAEGGTDRCVEDTIAPTKSTTTSSGAAITDNLTDTRCRLLGRTVKSTGVCNRTCTTNAGTLLHGTNYYCNLAVASGSKDWCDNLRRVWLDDGCARRINQDDIANAAQCANSTYKYYNSNFTNKGKNPDVKTGTDVCETSAAAASASENAGTLGAKLEAAKAACDANSAKIWNAATSTCIDKAVGGTTGGTTGGDTDGGTGATTGPLCIPDVPDSSGAQSGQYVPAGQTCPAGTHSLCPNNQPPVGSTCPDTSGSNPSDQNGDPQVATPNGFKIVVYADKNFKGASKTYTGDQADLKTTGMNDKISSYKILKGRWQLCPNADYKGAANVKCTRPWASNPDLSTAKNNNLNNKLSSLRPVTTTELVDAGDDVLASCRDANGVEVQPNEDNTCPTNASLQCPTGYQIVNGDCKQPVVTHERYLPVDKSFSGKAGEERCLLLGREWVPNGNGGDHGCSTVTCNSEKDGAPRFSGNADKAYCVNYAFDAPYAVVLNKDVTKSKKACTDLHRVWINRVGRCAQVPNRKDKDQTVVKSDRCTGAFTTYYIFKATAKNDECFKPDFFQKAKGVAKVTRSSLGNVLHVGPKAFCAAKDKTAHGDYHWSNGKCRKDPPPPPPAPVTPVSPADIPKHDTPNGSPLSNCLKGATHDSQITACYSQYGSADQKCYANGGHMADSVHGMMCVYPPKGPYIIVYQDKNYGGRSATITGSQSTSSLGFGISSVRIYGGSWKFCGNLESHDSSDDRNCWTTSSSMSNLADEPSIFGKYLNDKVTRITKE